MCNLPFMNPIWSQLVEKLLPKVGDNVGWLLPEWILIGGIILFVGLSCFKRRILDFWLGGLMLLVLTSLIFQWPSEAHLLFDGKYIVDQTGNWAKLLCVLGILAYLAFVRLSGKMAYHQQAELYLLLLGLQLGLHFLIGSQHFMLILVALELVSLSSYLLVAFPKN